MLIPHRRIGRESSIIHRIATSETINQAIMGSADAPEPAAAAAAAAAEGVPTAATTTTAAAEQDGQEAEEAVGLIGSDRPYGNLPSWESSGLGPEGSNCSGNGAPPYALSVAPMVGLEDWEFRANVCVG